MAVLCVGMMGGDTVDVVPVIWPPSCRWSLCYEEPAQPKIVPHTFYPPPPATLAPCSGGGAHYARHGSAQGGAHYARHGSAQGGAAKDTLPRRQGR